MKDYIPLLIVILISIIGAMGRKKKRQDMENISVPRQPEHRDDDIFGWLEKLNIDMNDSNESQEKPFMEIEKSVVNHASIVDEPVKKELIPNIFSKYSGFISPEEREDLISKEGISVVKKIGIADGDLTKQTTSESGLLNKRPKFEIDFKKAVIYNEILNRKYI